VKLAKCKGFFSRKLCGLYYAFYIFVFVGAWRHFERRAFKGSKVQLWQASKSMIIN
jgi:hypothetical protein